MTASEPSASMLREAIDAVHAGNSDMAVEVLNRILSKNPEHAGAHFLLGGEYAQVGMLEAAYREMDAALASEPELHQARFLYGLMKFTQGDIAGAQTLWLPLDRLRDSHALKQFAAGLLHVATYDLNGAVELLKAGLNAEGGNPSLTRSIEAVVRDLEGLMANTGTPDQVQPLGAEPDNHVLLSNYHPSEGA